MNVPLTFLFSFLSNKQKKTGVSMMDPNHFLMIMLSRFELYQIFSTPDYGKRFSSEVTHKVRPGVTTLCVLKKPLL